MGFQIVKQPDDHFAIFCGQTDTIIVYDATQDEIIDWFVEREAEKTRKRVAELIGHVSADNPRKAYYQFAMTWDEALASDKKHGGEAWKEYRQ